MASMLITILSGLLASLCTISQSFTPIVILPHHKQTIILHNPSSSSISPLQHSPLDPDPSSSFRITSLSPTTFQTRYTNFFPSYPSNDTCSSFTSSFSSLSATPNPSFFDISTFEGRPSSPGWKSGKLDSLTNWTLAEEPNRPIICEYEPSPLWLWTRWNGTVLSLTLLPILMTTAIGIGVHCAAHALSNANWPWWGVPPSDDVFVSQLAGFNYLWEYQLTLCTFILTFFTSEAYKHWRTVYFTTRAIQGRINDVCLLVSIGAERGECDVGWGCKGEGSVESEGIRMGWTSGYGRESAVLVERCTRLIKLSHTFFWAATPTYSDGLEEEGGGVAEEREMVGTMLLTPEGLDMLVAVGELKDVERKALLSSGLPPSQYAYILVQWVGSLVMQGFRDKMLLGGKGAGGLEENILRQLTMLRAEYFNIGDQTAGRMPLAYVQLVQVLVDSLVLLAPFALYPKLGSLAVLLTGLLTLFYKGLLELSKSFLDPFGNEGYPNQNIRVDVLVSELNFGAGSRWVKAGESLPNYDAEDDADITNGILKNAMLYPSNPLIKNDKV